MERLTTRNSMGVAVFKESYDCENCNESLWRLPDYGNGSPTDRLAEYEEADEQGLLLRLPCAVGDTVYVIAECENIPTVLDGTLYDSNGSPGTATGYYCPYEDECPHECIECEDLFDCDNFKNKSTVFKDEVDSITITEMEVLIVTKKCRVISQIGEFIFLTKEEAEAALERMQNGINEYIDRILEGEEHE